MKNKSNEKDFLTNRLLEFLQILTRGWLSYPFNDLYRGEVGLSTRMPAIYMERIEAAVLQNFGRKLPPMTSTPTIGEFLNKTVAYWYP